jgi:chitinase
MYLGFSHPIFNLGNDECGNPTGVIGTFNFKAMIADGFLNSTGGVADGMDYRYDNCSQTVGILF